MNDIFDARRHRIEKQEADDVKPQEGSRLSPLRKMRTRKKMPQTHSPSSQTHSSSPTTAPTSADPARADRIQTEPPASGVVHRHVDEYSEVMREENPEVEPLKAWVPKPPDITFSTQASNEHIVLLLRKHPITQLGWIITALFLALIPILFYGVSSFDFFPWNYQVAALILWYLLLTGFIIEAFLKWYFHVFIITDERVIDVDFLSLVYKHVSAAKIDNIEDVTSVTSGFFQSLFNYGTVFIQTAGAMREFQFEKVPYPAKVTRLLNELILEEEREKIEGRVS
jgi:membrane protein YdbS with pleckstrin-like domain